MLDFIEGMSTEFDFDPQVVFLGDIVDRGIDSRGALDAVYQAIKRWPESKLLISNHDDMFLEFTPIEDVRRPWAPLMCGVSADPLVFFGLQPRRSLLACCFREMFEIERYSI
ncbi:hypothetical protein HFO56_00395 [Rhizobium laguerreae]|uniref:hypothetical protein n=1 Tax=Rhizobium laguerreae TaxID=1076926 RepID=UPI001C90C974|nr:hypothetical protein [Rhizobium laguerreae]MBY3150887.1 hypothetical protein [Rhizobium laguerreae]